MERYSDIPLTDLIEDETRNEHEESFSFREFPEQMDCIRAGDIDGLKATFTGEAKAYYEEAIPDLSMLSGIFSYLCGCIQMLACEGGLPLSRAAAVSSKYMKTAREITDIPHFVEDLEKMQMEFTTEVFLHRRFSSGNSTVDQCMRFIYEHVNEKIVLSDLAKRSGYSLSHLQHLFSRYTGCSLSDHIRKEKTEKARLLLKHSNLSCAAISQKLSYCSQSHFTGQFKKETGMTPDQFRRTN